MPSPKKQENPPEHSIGSRVKTLRERLGLNFEEFSVLTRSFDPEGIAAVTLRRYEREDDGATSPGLRELRILCDTLGVSADFLLRGAEPLDSADWDSLKAIIQRIATEHDLPRAGKDPYDKHFRDEALKRARLHTKKPKAD